MKLYNVTENEMFFEDYRPLPPLRGLSVTELQKLKDNLLEVAENAYIYHSIMLEIGINADIAKVDLYIRMYSRKEGKNK